MDQRKKFIGPKTRPVVISVPAVPGDDNFWDDQPSKISKRLRSDLSSNNYGL